MAKILQLNRKAIFYLGAVQLQSAVNTHRLFKMLNEP